MSAPLLQTTRIPVASDLLKVAAVFAVALGMVVAGLAVAGRMDSLVAVIVAWAATFAGAVGGYWLGIFPRGDLFIASRLMASMLVRAGIPLFAVAIGKFRFPEWIEGGMVWFIVLFYLVGLLADAVLLGVRSREMAGQQPAAGRAQQVGNRD